jgi:hypothetical protein
MEKVARWGISQHGLTAIMGLLAFALTVAGFYVAGTALLAHERHVAADRYVAVNGVSTADAACVAPAVHWYSFDPYGYSKDANNSLLVCAGVRWEHTD